MVEDIQDSTAGYAATKAETPNCSRRPDHPVRRDDRKRSESPPLIRPACLVVEALSNQEEGSQRGYQKDRSRSTRHSLDSRVPAGRVR